MKWLQLPGLLLLLLLGGPLRGAGEPTTALPDPVALPGDWWTYFEPREAIDSDTLQKRIDAANKFLAELDQSLRKAGNTDQARLIKSIVSDLDRFLELKNASPPTPAPTVTPPETYTLEDALRLFGEWQTLKQRVDAESEESAWLSTVLGEQRKQQSRLRNRYLEMDEHAPDRLEKGLALMHRRLSLELQRLELGRRKILLEQETERATRKRAELDNIAERLVASAKESQHWESEYHKAQQAIEKLRAESARVPAVKSGQGELSPDLTEPQYTALVTVRRDIDIRVHELRALQARKALSLIRFVTGDSDTDNKAVRAQISEFETLEASVDAQRERWERVIERVRGMLADPDSRATQGKLHTSMQRELDKAGKLLRLLQREQAMGEYIVQLLEARLYASEGWFHLNLQEFYDGFLKTGAVTIDLLGATLFEINETPVTTLGLLRVALILTIALWLSRIIRRAIRHLGERRGGLNRSSLYAFGRMVHYLILAIGIIIGLSSIGIDFTKFALFASALGVGIGFGLQTLISNFVAGLIILFEKSLKVGDFVELESGVTGEVKEINMRSTLITTNDNIDILVPNSEFVGGRVINWTLREAYRRVRVPFGVAYGTDKEKVRKAVLEAAANVPWTLINIKSRRPQVWFVEFGDSSLNFELVVWLTPEAVNRPGAVTAAYLWEIESKLKEYGIEVPFPQRDLHLRSAFGLRDEAARGLLTPAGASATDTQPKG